MSTSAAEASKGRRTEGTRPGGRSARIVRVVLDSAYEELLRRGYGALRVEDVAAISGVNKTTIYRRWPSKGALVHAACVEREDEEPLREVGSIREDLVAAVMDAIVRFASPEKLGMIRMLQTERDEPELSAIAKALRVRHRAVRIALVERAIERGELPSHVDPSLVVEMILSTVYTRVLRYDEPVDVRFVENVVDVVLAALPARP